MADGVNLFDALYKLQIGVGESIFDPIAQELMQHFHPEALARLQPS